MSEYQVDCIELKTNEHQEHYGQFIFHPLEYGQGLILGNMYAFTLNLKV